MKRLKCQSNCLLSLSIINNREIKIHVYGKRQTLDSSWEFLREKNKQIKTVQKSSYGENWLETTYFGVEVINSKRQLRGKLGHVVQIHVCRLAWTWILISLMFCHGNISSAPMKDYVSSFFYWSKPSAGCITAILVIGLEHSPEGVFTMTFLILPSCPGYTSTILSMIHLPPTVFGSATITKSSTWTLRLLVFHFLRGTNKGNTRLWSSVAKRNLQSSQRIQLPSWGFLSHERVLAELVGTFCPTAYH